MAKTSDPKLSPHPRSILGTTLSIGLLFILAALISLALSLSSLTDLSRQIRHSSLEGLANRYRISLERGLRIGRPLEGYAGLRGDLENTLAFTDNLTGLGVVNLSGSLVEAAGSLALPLEIGDWREIPPEGSSNWFSLADSGEVYRLPLRGRQAVAEGWLVLAANSNLQKTANQRFLVNLLLLLLVLTPLLVGLELLILTWLGSPLAREIQQRRRKNWLLGLNVGALVVFNLGVFLFFATPFREAELDKIKLIGAIEAYDLERLVNKNVPLAAIRGMEAHLTQVQTSAREIAAIRLEAVHSFREESGRALAETGKTLSDAERVEIPVYRKATRPEGKPLEVARLFFTLNPEPLWQAIRTLGVNLLTSLVASLLLFLEILGLLLHWKGGGVLQLERQLEGGSTDWQTACSRALVFFFFFGYDMVLSLVPITASQLPGELWPLPASILSAIPITIEALTMGLGIILAGEFFHRARTTRILQLAVFTSCLGALMACLAPTIGWFVLARALGGAGFGVVFMTCQLNLVSGK
ncbi:MAG: hypothetical protein LBU79_02175, partial [Planctomycetota bacterium]|nr:hypothetical protein [Planctomycetota bacterium]